MRFERRRLGRVKVGTRVFLPIRPRMIYTVTDEACVNPEHLAVRREYDGTLEAWSRKWIVNLVPEVKS